MNDFPGNRSPFRAGFLRVALFIGGAWVEIPMTDLEDDGVSITRRASETGTATFTLKDPTGRWSPRHPASPYYGLIGRGTPVRIQVELTSGTVRDRYYGQVVTWQPRWTKTGAEDARVDVECAGAIRRLSQGASPLRSPLYRGLISTGANLVAYWPMEDGRNAKSFAAAVGGRRMTVSTGGCTPAAYDSFAASAPIPTIGSATLTATVPSYLSSNQAQVRWIGRIPAGTPSGAVLVRVVGNGTLGWAEVRHGGPTTLQVEAFNDAGASVGAATWSLGQVEGRDLRFSFQLTQSGADIAVTLATYEVGSSLALFNSGTFSGVTLGSVPRVIVNPDQVALGDVAVGHLTFERTITTLFSTSAAVLAGHAGERADSRIARLCAENGVTFALFSATGAQLMGPQGRDDLLTLLRECEATDGGMLYEPRSTTHLAYRTGESLYSQTPAATVPYVDNLLLPFEPVEDDAGTRNRVTVTRDGGASATVEETTGPLGTATVGIYDEGVTLSLAADDDAERQAQWRVHLGTVDEARWPTIGYDLADPRMNAGLRDALLSAAGLGNRIDVTDLPPWLPPFDVSQIVEAYTERIAPLSYRIELACTPARPYRVPEWDRAGDRWSGDGTTTPALTATQTAFTVVPPAGVTWTSADGQYGILVGGELMTVTNVTGGTAFTVVRAVNGVSKSHLAGSAVTLADPVYYGL